MRADVTVVGFSDPQRRGRHRVQHAKARISDALGSSRPPARFDAPPSRCQAVPWQVADVPVVAGTAPLRRDGARCAFESVAISSCEHFARQRCGYARRREGLVFV